MKNKSNDDYSDYDIYDRDFDKPVTRSINPKKYKKSKGSLKAKRVIRRQRKGNLGSHNKYQNRSFNSFTKSNYWVPTFITQIGYSESDYGSYIEDDEIDGLELDRSEELLSARLLFPLWQNKSSLLSLNVSQLNLSSSLESRDDSNNQLVNNRKIKERSYGMLWRNMMNDQSIVGFHLSYDSHEKDEIDNVFEFITVGFEYLSNGWDFRANGYIPLSDNIVIVGDDFYKQYTGVDFEIGHSILSDKFKLYAGGYHFEIGETVVNSGNSVTTYNPGGDQLKGVRARASLNPVDFLFLDYEYNHDSDNIKNNYFGIRLKIPFGKAGYSSIISRRMTDDIYRRANYVQ